MDKIDKLLDAIEHPDRYSDRELETMLADPEVMEIYQILDKTKASLSPIAAPDVDAEWKAFESAHNKRKFSIPNFFPRNIAATISIGVVSLAALATVVGVSVSHVIDQKTETQVAEIAAVTKEDASKNDTVVSIEDTPAVAPETIVFDNETFETIVGRIAEYYGCDVEFASDRSKSLRLYFRWNQAHTLGEVVENLNNFEQIHLTLSDNTIKIY